MKKIEERRRTQKEPSEYRIVNSLVLYCIYVSDKRFKVILGSFENLNTCNDAWIEARRRPRKNCELIINWNTHPDRCYDKLEFSAYLPNSFIREKGRKQQKEAINNVPLDGRATNQDISARKAFISISVH